MVAFVIYNMITLVALINFYFIFVASFFIHLPRWLNYSSDPHAWIILIVLLPLTGLIFNLQYKFIAALIISMIFSFIFMHISSDSMAFHRCFLFTSQKYDGRKSKKASHFVSGH